MPRESHRKRCVRCNRVGWYRPRERRCKVITRRWRRSFWCWGRLEAIREQTQTVQGKARRLLTLRWEQRHRTLVYWATRQAQAWDRV